MLSNTQIRLFLTRRIRILHRTFSTEANVEETVEPEKKKTPRKKSTEVKMSKDILAYFNKPGRQHILNNYPETILRRKMKTPDILYNTSLENAEKIVSHLIKDLPPERPIVEMNPGEGHITKLLINKTKNNLLLYEPEAKFHKNLNKLIIDNPKRNITLKNIDLTSLWKFMMIDKIDNGSRTQEALKGIPKKDFTEDPNVRIFAATCSLPFLKHLINGITFQNSLMAYGRCELYLCMSPTLFIHLTCSKDAGYMMYRIYSILFQLFFEYELICKLDRKDFLPWQAELKSVRYAKIQKFTRIDPNSLYLVKCVPRRNLFEHIMPDNLVRFWFFVKQHYVSRKNRVIPKMERWVPNCGPRLIVNPHPAEPPKLRNPKLDLSTLPELSQPCYELTAKNYVENFNIFTEFGDLSPSQVLALFDQFISWPEFRESSFNASLEHTLMKMHSHPDETVESRDLVAEVEEEEEEEEKKT